jgi:acetyltransferase-like isoleucine patch superfamily enzyme
VAENLESPQFNYELLNACGENVFISRNVEIRRPHLVTVGSNVAIDTGFYLTSSALIGDYIHIAPYVTVIGGAGASLEMGHFTTIAAGSRLICLGDEHLGNGLVGPTIPEEYRDNTIGGKIKMVKFSSIATNVVVMPGVTIGEGSVVGAGSVVTKDTEPWTIYVGIPAKPLRSRDSEKMLRMAHDLGYE